MPGDFPQVIDDIEEMYEVTATEFYHCIPLEIAPQYLEAGGIIQGDVPTWRTDPMPYGGVKDSGIGREGPAYTYRELTEERLLVLSR